MLRLNRAAGRVLAIRVAVADLAAVAAFAPAAGPGSPLTGAPVRSTITWLVEEA